MKIGTVGTNFIAESFIDAARKAGADVTTVYSRTSEIARSFSQKNNVVSASSDKTDFLRSDLIDAVYIATPNSLHFEWAREALLHQKHVICEKPAVPTVREWDALGSLAEHQGLFLFEAMTVPHLPNLQLLKEQLPRLGRLRLVQMNFSQYSSRYDSFLCGELPNAFNPAFSAGALMDLGCYNIRFMLELFGKPRTVQYFPNKAKNGIDTSGVFVAAYADFTCEAVACKDSRSENTIQIQGENGYIVIPSAASTLSNGFTVFSKDGSSHYQAQDESNVLFYEMTAFLRAARESDLQWFRTLFESSRTQIDLLEQARRGVGIVFPSDDIKRQET